VAEYDYLDKLDDAGWAWEFLRRSGNYRADYDHLQTLDASDSEHDDLAKKWHVRRMLDPTLREVPEFYCEQYEREYLDDLMRQAPRQWDKFVSENQPPQFELDVWKRAIICNDLSNMDPSPTSIARRLYTGYKNESHEREHHPARHRVRYGLKRFKELQSEYLKIAYSNTLRI
jgi:hypothetical protein